MKTVKTLVLVLVLGMFGYVYADQDSQTTTEKARPAAKQCMMTANDASCCVPGAECCKDGAECCKQACCSGGDCCKAGEACCKAGEDSCKAGSCCSAAKTADGKQTAHAAKHHSAKEVAACCKTSDDTKTGCCGSGCSIARATKK